MRWDQQSALDLLVPGPPLTRPLSRNRTEPLCRIVAVPSPRAVPTTFIALTTFGAPVLQLWRYLRELLFSFNLEIGREGRRESGACPVGLRQHPRYQEPRARNEL